MKIRRNAIRLIITAAGMTVLLLACGKKDAKAKAETETLKPRVKVEKAVSGDFAEKMYYTGILSAWQEAELAPAMPGRVKKVYVNEGDRVKAGDPLADMDQTQLETTQSQYDMASTTYNRMKALYEAGAIPQSQFEQAETAYKQASLGLSSVKDNTRICAPFKGVVTAVSRQAGEMYSGMSSGPGSISGLIRVSDLTRMKMDIMVSEKAVVRLSKGQEVDLDVDALPDKAFKGRIDWINPSADPVTRTFKIRVEIPNPSMLLRPGFFGKAGVILGQKKNVLAVNESAVLEGKYLFVLNKDGKAERREVELGITNEDRLEILKGVQTGDQIIVSGNRGLADGVEVEIIQ